jgi:hypothetical protein
MRRFILLTLVALLLAAGLAAQEHTAALKFKLLEAAEYNLDMFYSSELQRLYVQLDFDIPKSNLDPQYHYGVFLDKGAQFQAITISGNYESHYWVNNLQPEHFEPVLTQRSLLSADCPALFFGLSMNDFDKLPDTAHYRIWYYLSVPPFQLDSSQKLSTGIEASQYWYPRNMSSPSTVNLKLTTTPYLTLLVGNSFAAKDDKDFSRVHTSNYIESVDNPCSLKLIRE